MNKTIQFNPDLFRVSSKQNRTRKAKPKDESGGEIRVKHPLREGGERNKSTKTIRRNLLNFIRKQQERNFKHLIQNDKNIVDKRGGEQDFNSDFDESLEYLMEIAKRQNQGLESSTKRQNQGLESSAKPSVQQGGRSSPEPLLEQGARTSQAHLQQQVIKPTQEPSIGGNIQSLNTSVPKNVFEQNHPFLQNRITPPNHTFRKPPSSYGGGSGIDIGLPDSLYSTESPLFKDDTIPYSSYPAIKLQPPPAYGCLKGGNLPTYRTYHNLTQKNRPPSSVAQMLSNPDAFGGVKETIPIDSPQFVSNILEDARQKSKERTKQVVDSVIQEAEKQNAKKNRSNLKYLKQRKTIRRTYNVGKSRFQPKVGILISNKTIRNHISTQSQLLKQTPIADVRKFLVKKGFIKVGTAAPNDVLRKMYESVFLICGEVENHNSENLLYNYFNDKS